MKKEELTIGISNLNEYKKLLNAAEGQVKQLQKSIELIDTFNFEIQVGD